MRLRAILRESLPILASLWCAACTKGDTRLEAQAAAPNGNVASAALPRAIANDQPEDGQWLRPAKDYSSSRFSKLEQITARNAANLRVAFTFSTGVNRGHEAAPLVVNNTMYIVTPFPNILY